MAKASTSKVYAKALFELAKEKNTLDVVSGELRELNEWTTENKNLKSVLSADIYSASQKTAVWKEISEKISPNPLVSNFIDLLLQKNRFSMFAQIQSEFEALLDQSKGVVRGRVSTVEALSDAEREDLSKAFSKRLGKKVVLESTLDKSLIGGLVVNIQGMTFDGSLKTTIRQLKEKLERQSI